MAAVLYGINVVSGGTSNGQVGAMGGGSPNAVTAPQLALLASGGTNWNNLSATMSTLVADAGSPTSAHVSAANSAYTALVADMATVTGGGNSTPYDVTVIVNSTNVPTLSKLRLALRALVRQFTGDSRLTE